jgi:hypothetical protein
MEEISGTTELTINTGTREVVRTFSGEEDGLWLCRNPESIEDTQSYGLV